MQRTPFLVVAAAAISVFAENASAVDFPTMKSGLWEQSVAREGAPSKSAVTKICIDAAVQKEMLNIGMGSMKSMCSKNDIRREGNKMFGDAECKIGDSTMKSKSVTTFTGDTAYKTEVKATYAPPLMGKADSSTTIEAKWTGACPPGAKPGDVMLPDGKTINMRSMGAPPAASGGGTGTGTK